MSTIAYTSTGWAVPLCTTTAWLSASASFWYINNVLISAVACLCLTARGLLLQIHGFRLNCWEEHTTEVSEVYEKPESSECMRRLGAIGDKNWNDYCSEEVHDMTGHLMTYPIQVSAYLL